MKAPKINALEIRRLANNRQVQQRIQRDAEALAASAAQLAPRLTGAGAASIHAERQLDGSWRVSWDTEHDYMRFQELGTERQDPQPFLRPAANKLRRF